MQSNQEMREQTAQFSKASAVSSAADEDLRALDGFRFLWVELTNRCNLTCAHCYAESGPRPSRKDVLTTADYKRLLEEAAALGCRAVQFIGGEPTLHRGLPELITWARALRYEHTEQSYPIRFSLVLSITGSAWRCRSMPMIRMSMTP